MTEQGTTVRETAETETDRLFYQGWAALNEAELDRLDDLLDRLNSTLNDMALVEMWPLANGISAAITPVTRDAVTPAFNEIFGDNGRFFFITLQASGKAPQGFTAEDHVARFPYANIKRSADLLKGAAEVGYLNNHGDGTFTVTKKGRKAIEAINDGFYSALGDLQTIDDNSVEQIENLLGKVVSASLEADQPADKSPLIISYNSHTHPDALPLAKIDQRLDDLNAFRDVSHRAAWSEAHDLSGRTWETFSHVHNGQSNTAAALAENLPFRGYSEEDYAASLAELVKLGWIEDGSDGYQATEAGKQVRQTAEDKTNEYFYAPWSVLEGSELNQLRVGLMRLKVNLEGQAEASTS